MPVYTLEEHSTEDQKRTLKTVLPLILLASLPALIFAFAAAGNSPVMIAVILLVFAIVVSIGIVLGTRARSTIRLTTDYDRVVYDRAGRPSVSISRLEIAKIVEDPESGLSIESIDPTMKIFVSKQFRNYDNLKAELNTWSPVVNEPKSSRPLTWIIVGLTIAVLLSIGAFVFKIKECFYGVLLTLASPLIYEFVQEFRSFKATKKISKLFQLLS